MKAVDIGRLLCALATAGCCGALAAQPVALTIYAPQAESVFVSGSFDPWWQKRYPLKKDAQGRWHIVLDLSPGRYEYQFLVDGQWRYDPEITQIDDSLGGRNNVLLVVP